MSVLSQTFHLILRSGQYISDMLLNGELVDTYNLDNV